MLRAVHAVEPVVRGHDAERAAFAHRELERHERDLAERALVDDGVDRHAFELGVVRGEVLHRGGDAFRLHAAHERGRGLAREQRVFRVALEVAARERRAVDVDGGPEQHPARLRARLGADHRADALDEVDVPRRAERGAARGAERRHAVAAFAREAGATGAVRPVGDVDRRDPEPLARHRRPQPFSGKERGLLVEGELGDEPGDVTRHGGPSGAGAQEPPAWVAVSVRSGSSSRISASWHRPAVARTGRRTVRPAADSLPRDLR